MYCVFRLCQINYYHTIPYLTIFNNRYKTEEIPQEWKHGRIIKIYKRKGKKGQCCNERGITLSKIFERIINNKILVKINITECQGGGKKGASTTDHLKISLAASNYICHAQKWDNWRTSKISKKNQ